MRKKYRGVRGAMDADANFDLELSQPTTNPLHATKPSSAYLQSQKRARDESSPSNLDRNPVNHHVKPGWRTILSAAILFLGGLTLLILGTVVYVDSSKGGSVVSKDQGQDLLIVGAVMLLPGSYGTISLFGAWRKWRGYTYDSMPLLD